MDQQPKVVVPAAESFKRLIEINSTLFGTSNDGKQWDNWRRYLVAAARA